MTILKTKDFTNEDTGTCPVCGYTDCSLVEHCGQDHEVEDGVIIYYMICNKCNTEFNEVNKIEFSYNEATRLGNSLTEIVIPEILDEKEES